MLRKSVLFSTVLVLASAFCGCAYLEELENEPSEDTNAADITVKELSAKTEKAADPKGVFEKCHSYILRQEMSGEDNNGASYTRMVEIKFKLPRYLKTTTYMNDKPVLIVIFDGKKAISVNCETDQVTEIKGRSYELIEVLADLGHPSSTMTSVFPKVNLSEVSINALVPVKYYKAVCYSKYEDLPPITFYIGKDNFLTKKLETTRFTTGGSYKYISETEKYSQYDSVWVASESKVTAGDSTFTYKIVDYKMNIDIPDSEFEVPTPWYLQNIKKDKSAGQSKEKAPVSE